MSGEVKAKQDLENVGKFVIKGEQHKDKIKSEVRQFMANPGKGKKPEEEKS